jgi:hypothetical protein
VGEHDDGVRSRVKAAAISAQPNVAGPATAQTTSGTAPEVMSRTPLTAVRARRSPAATPKSSVARRGIRRKRPPTAMIPTQPTTATPCSRAAPMSWRAPDSAGEAQISRPAGSAMTCTFTPCCLCLPPEKYGRSRPDPMPTRSMRSRMPSASAATGSASTPINATAIQATRDGQRANDHRPPIAEMRGGDGQTIVRHRARCSHAEKG